MRKFTFNDFFQRNFIEITLHEGERKNLKFIIRCYINKKRPFQPIIVHNLINDLPREITSLSFRLLCAKHLNCGKKSSTMNDDVEILDKNTQITVQERRHTVHTQEELLENK